MDANQVYTAGTSLAGSLVAVALMDKLVEKGLLTREDASGVLQHALQSTPIHRIESGDKARDILADMIKRNAPRR